MNEILEQLKTMSRRELFAVMREALNLLEAMEDDSPKSQTEVPQDAPVDEITQTTA